MGNTWFWSDLHFKHQNICRDQGKESYTQRHLVWGDSTDDMTYGLIDNYNSVVGDDDTVYLLGDMCMGKIDESLPLLGRLNGHKRCILGNHDRPFPANKNSLKWFPRYENFFEDIRIHDTIEIDGNIVELNHFPYTGDSHDSDRYSDFRPVDNGLWLAHGHCHSELAFYGERMVHVGVDSNWEKYGVERYHPIPIEAVAQLIKDHS